MDEAVSARPAKVGPIARGCRAGLGPNGDKTKFGFQFHPALGGRGKIRKHRPNGLLLLGIDRIGDIDADKWHRLGLADHPQRTPVDFSAPFHQRRCVVGYDRAIRLAIDQGKGGIVTTRLLPVAKFLPATEGTLKKEIKPTESPITIETEQKTILVVEDDPDVLETVTTILSSFSYQVLEAIDGLSALEVLNQNGGIDLVFSDVIMPGDMTGIELGHEITKQHPNVKFLLSSGYPEDSFDQSENPIVGFNFLAKPYAMEQLEEKIRETLYS